ncbi:MAG: translation initiation factor [Bacteroidales bacterium]|nr:translation initiation factor [Bacteroidales bacterium]MDD3431224.1 translation initiation factor [Bacteroidales bacterium]
MPVQDWKERLAALAGANNKQTENTESSGQKSGPNPEPASAAAAIKKGQLCIRFEKRNGKPATIISEFKGSQKELTELAGKLKSTLGIGGSAKDDEILLQGDLRDKIVSFLQKSGYSVKGDYQKKGPR